MSRFLTRFTVVLILLLATLFITAGIVLPQHFSSGAEVQAARLPAPPSSPATNAGQPIFPYCYNWDLSHSFLDPPITDLHVGLWGPTVLLSEYLGAGNPFGAAQQNLQPNGVLELVYETADPIPADQVVHIGFCTDKPIFWTVPGTGIAPFYWTSNGDPVEPSLPLPGFDWWWLPEADRFEIGVFNGNDDNQQLNAIAIEIVSLEVATLPAGTAPFTLDQLVADNPDLENLLWRPVMTDTVRVPPGENRFFEISLAPTGQLGDFVVARAQFREPVSGQLVDLFSQGQVVIPPRPTYCYNWDIPNNTGQDANDLHIGLQGIKNISDVYMGSLNPFGGPDPSSGYNAGVDVYELNFSGAVVPDGGIAHIGFCSDQPVMLPGGFGGLPAHYWTLDGDYIGSPIPLPALDWWWLADGGVQVGLANGDDAATGETIFVETVELAVADEVLPLDALNGQDLAGVEWVQVPAGELPTLQPGDEFALLDLPAGVGGIASPGDVLLVHVAASSDPTGSEAAVNLFSQTIIPIPPTYCYNWDFFNRTGVDANDLHIGLLGPTQISQVYTGSLNPFGPPDATSGLDTNGVYQLNFSGAVVSPDGLAHIGFCSDNPVLMTWGEDGLPPFFWTQNGEPLEPEVPLPGWDWWWLREGVGIGIFNDTGEPLVIDVLEIAPLDEPLMLNDLDWDALDEMGLDWETVPEVAGTTLQPGAESFFDVFFEVDVEGTYIGRLQVHDPDDAEFPLHLITQSRPVIPPPPTYCYNWDIPNKTGQDANDLHLALRGVRQLSHVYMGSGNPFGAPDARSGYDPELGAYLVWFTGGLVPPDGIAHIGFCTDQPIVALSSENGLPPHYWTIDDDIIGDPIPVPGFDWWWLADGRFQFGLLNGDDPATGVPIDPGPLEFTVLEEALPLESLLWDEVDNLSWQPLEDPDAIAPGEITLVDMPPEARQGGAVIVRFGSSAPQSEQTARALAQATIPPPPRYCYNWDFFNRTSQRVNDLHLHLKGVSRLTNVYTGALNPFGPPDGASGYDAASGVYKLWFSGATIPPDGLVHLGFCTDRPILRLDRESGLPPFYWTWNGERVQPDPILPGVGWDWVSRDLLRVQILNGHTFSLTLQALNLRDPGEAVMLGELTGDMVGQMPLLQDLLPTPQTLPPGSSRVFDVPLGGGNGRLALNQAEPDQPYVLEMVLVDESDPDNMVRVYTQGLLTEPELYLPFITRSP